MKNLLLGISLLILCKAGAQSPALSIADSLYAAGNYSKALGTYQELPENAANVLQIARAYKALGNKALALKAYKQTLELDNNQVIAALEYGKLLMTRLKFKEADTVFQDLSLRYPDNPEYHYQRGRVLKAIRPDTIRTPELLVREYVGAFAKAVSLDSTHLKAIGQLALHHLQHRNYPEVEQLCATALRQDPENIEIINLLAQNFYNRGYYTEAADNFEKLLALGQKSAFIHEKLGYSYYQERLYELAIEQYLILLEYDDEHYGTYHILAKLYNFMKEEEKAIEAGEKALYFKDLPLDDVYMTLGATYRIHKQWPEAIEQFQKAIKENPDAGNAYHNLAICADNFYKDKKAVVRLYEQFISKFKSNPKYLYQVKLSQDRLKILNREIFMEKDGN